MKTKKNRDNRKKKKKSFWPQILLPLPHPPFSTPPFPLPALTCRQMTTSIPNKAVITSEVGGASGKVNQLNIIPAVKAHRNITLPSLLFCSLSVSLKFPSSFFFPPLSLSSLPPSFLLLPHPPLIILSPSPLNSPSHLFSFSLTSHSPSLLP